MTGGQAQACLHKWTIKYALCHNIILLTISLFAVIEARVHQGRVRFCTWKTFRMILSRDLRTWIYHWIISEYTSCLPCCCSWIYLPCLKYTLGKKLCIGVYQEERNKTCESLHHFVLVPKRPHTIIPCIFSQDSNFQTLMELLWGE